MEYTGFDVVKKQSKQLNTTTKTYQTEGTQTQTAEYLFLPPLIDIQVNGYAGVDFNTEGLTLAKVETVSEKLRRAGIGYYFPTIITNDPQFISQQIEAVVAAVEQSEVCAQMIKGIHVEGPFISKEDGPRGAHPIEFVRAPERQFVDQWLSASKGLFKLLTMSPEWPNSAEFIEYCQSKGIVVSIGHTNANTEQIEQAVQAGAQLSTHLGNGAHAYIKRHPNYIWDQLSQDDLYASVIGDGHHLPTSVLKVFGKIKNDHLILISDSTQFAGAKPGKYQTLIGGTVTLNAEKRLYIDDNPDLLAGSAMNLMDMINHVVSDKIFSLDYALACATTHPQALLKNVVTFAQNDIVVVKQVDQQLEVVDYIKDIN